MPKDLHKKPFDEGTIIKLALYENYLKEWLPVFLSKSIPQFNTINIFDFFAGPGLDKNKQKGSPLITINLLKSYINTIVTNKQTISLYFNDKDKKKIKQLKQNIDAITYPLSSLNINYASEDFLNIFTSYLPIMSKTSTANFLFLDQTGIKHITNEIFKSIIALPATDFMFFISSSTLHRFNEHKDIGKYIKIDNNETISTQYYHIHRSVLEYYRNLIPEDKQYYLAPFSIKKNANVYGLIFGTGHLLGIDKFLTQCWKMDAITGEANFDIDNDRIDPARPSLFETLNKPKKIQVFENELVSKVLSKELCTNKGIYLYSLYNGFLAQHARKIMSKLISSGDLPKQKINISYNSCKYGTPEIKIIYN